MPRCPRCGADVVLMSHPLETVNDDYIGAHDEAVQTVVKRGRGEGEVRTRYRHTFRWLCDSCHGALTDDQVRQ